MLRVVDDIWRLQECAAYLLHEKLRSPNCDGKSLIGNCTHKQYKQEEENKCAMIYNRSYGNNNMSHFSRHGTCWSGQNKTQAI